MKYGIYELSGDPTEAVDYGVGTTAHEAREAASRRARTMVERGEIQPPIQIRPVPLHSSGAATPRLLFGLALMSAITLAFITGFAL